MRCSFCAEEIQDAAIVCRYCGARKRDGIWMESEATEVVSRHSRPAGSFTLRFAGALFIASAAFELWSITSEVALFGALRGGVVAISYHALFVAVFLSMGIGLWRATSWGYRAVLTGTLIYALDKVLYLLDDAARSASIAALTRNYGQVIGSVDPESIDLIVTAMTLMFLVCGVGFAVYVHRRRSYFESTEPGSHSPL